MDRSPISRQIWVFASLAAILALVFSACAGATPTEAPAFTREAEFPTQPPPPTEVPPQDTETPNQPQQEAALTLWVSVEPNELELLGSELDTFQADHPGVSVEVENIPYGEIEPRLFMNLAAGVAPDVAALSYNTIARLVEQDLLVPPDFSLLTNVEDILPQALQTYFFKDVLYALPWRRQACSPNYLALALPRPSSQRYDVASRLINYLAGYEVQARNYKETGWYPVRQSVYNDVGLECPPAAAILLPAQYVQPTISLVQERQVQIAGIIGAVQLNPNLATAWVEDGKTRVAAEPLRFPVPQQQVDEQFYGGNGLAIGALFVDSSPEINPGDYAVTCRADGDWALCDLIDANGERFTVKPVDFAQTPAPVGQPFVLLEQGSFRKCWYFDSLKICINVG